MMLVPSTSNSEDIITNILEPKSYIIACNQPVYHQSQAAELSTESDHGSNQRKSRAEQPMEVSEGVPSRSGLRAQSHWSYSNERSHELSLQKTTSLRHRAKLLGRKYRNKTCLFRVLKMYLMDMIPWKILDTILTRTYNRFCHTDEFMKALMEMVQRHAALKQDLARPMGRTNKSRIGIGVEEKNEEFIYSLPLEAE